MPVNAHLQRVTLLLVGVSVALLHVALENRAPGSNLPLLGASLASAFGFAFLTRKTQEGSWSLAAVAGVLAVTLLPLPWDWVARSRFGIGSPYEVQFVCVLRNLMIALVAKPRLPQATNYAVLASLFLVVFGYLWAEVAWLAALLAVYALLGAWWLLAAYWDGLGGRFADSSESAVPVRPAVAAIAALVLTAVLLLPLAGNSPATTALRGFMPTSGGTDWHDPFAHGGVGDGDQMVAAKEQASSFGPVDTELFLESKMPSLYDAFNELSQAAPEKKKRLRRAIPLSPSQMLANHEKTGTTQQATREFSTVRQPTPHRHGLDDRLSAALLLVKGRTPLHLGLETYDLWDGRSLIASHPTTRVATVLRNEDESGRRWLNFSVVHPADAFPATGSAQVRVINLKTERVPTPAGATGVTMKGLHSADMFTSAADGSLAMDVEHIPQLTIFEFSSALRDRNADLALARETPATDTGRVADLAAEWTEGAPVGWPQVEAIVGRLRDRYTHDRDAVAPVEVEDSVEHFLFESKRGPDYLFAASTAVLLRSLGYDTRVRSGFYANPESRSRTSRLTPILAEDAHFWVEVRTRSGLRFVKNGDSLPGVWVTIEPTPGYEVLYAPESLLAWLGRSASAWLSAFAARPVSSSFVVLALVFLAIVRRQLLDGLLIALWSIRSLTIKEPDLVRVTLRCLEWRAWAHRKSRPVGTPVGRWSALDTQDEFVALAGWALYGMGAPPPVPLQSARAACRRAIRTRFQTPTPHSEEPGCKP